MTYWVVGAGGIGCAIGARLAQHRRLIFVDSWREHVDAMRKSGLTVDYPDGPIHVEPVEAWHLTELASITDRPEVVLLAVKSYQTSDTVAALLPYLTETSVVVSLQNCINEDTIASIVGPHRTIGAMVRFDGALKGPGHGSATRKERRLVIGELDGRITPRLENLGTALSQSVHTDLSDNIWRELWSKLVRNTEVNAVAVVGGFGMGQIVTEPTARRLAIALGMETVKVALKLGIDLDPTELDGPAEAYFQPFDSPEVNSLEDHFRRMFEAYPQVKASMLQDVEKGRPTEIDYMNGYVVKKGAEVGVPTPLNAEMVRLVKEVEAGSRHPAADAVANVFAPLLSGVLA
jgi:2-dehydropantoate 2-reductase